MDAQGQLAAGAAEEIPEPDREDHRGGQDDRHERVEARQRGPDVIIAEHPHEGRTQTPVYVRMHFALKIQH